MLTPAQQEQVADGARAERRGDDEHRSSPSCSPASRRPCRRRSCDINTDARPIALQIALLVPLLAALLGLFTGFRMTRLPDPEPSGAAETMLAG